MATATASVRVGHCSPDAPAVDVHVDGEPAFRDVGFGDVTDYAELDGGSHKVRVVPAGDGEAVIEATLDLDAGTSYTVLTTGMLDDIDAMVPSDEPGSVPDGTTYVRFVHAAPDAPAVDVAVTDGPVLFENVSFGGFEDYTPVDAGTYDLEVRPAGGRDVVPSLSGTDLPGGEAVTVYAVGQVEEDTLAAVVSGDRAAAAMADD